MTLSQIPSSPSFRSSAVNAVAIIPLLSSDGKGEDDNTTHSSQSFLELMEALSRHKDQSQPCTQTGDDIMLVVPNSSLTRPGNWKYDNTPLKNFHWEYGCQRLTVFDGRPYNSRMAHDRLLNHELTRNWIDLCPHRRTAALIGVLNMRDVPDIETLIRAEQEWQQWAERYSTPPYEVTAHGRDFERDFVVQRLFVFDSFHEDSKVDMSTMSLGSSLVAFPPAEGDNSTKVMDMHTNVVVTDLAVAIFQELEDRIRESDMTIGSDGQPLSSAAARSRFFQLAQKESSSENEEGPQGSDLNVNNLAAVVSQDNQLAASASGANKNRHPKDRESIQIKLSNAVKGSSSEAQLLTPLDDVWDYSELKPSDAQEMLRREVGRREKFAADLSLLAGSPLDAYERYMKAADLCKTSCPDPLWYASALEGCGAAHVAMVEAGGYNVDTYLESAFQLPDEFMACSVASGEKTTKQTMSKVVKALCDDALRVLSRHPKLACFRAELLLKMAWYTGEVEDTHIRCKWGLGEGCYGGDPGSEKRRWEVHSSTQLSFLELKNKHGEDVVRLNTLNRLQKWTKFMHVAVAAGGLDPVTRADVALRCASLCLKGLRPTDKPTSTVRSEERVVFHRKATFFAVAAAEALSEIDGQAPDDRSSAMWVTVSNLLSKSSNASNPGNYGWATLRAVSLHALSMQGLKETSEDAAVQLLSLMSEIKPVKSKYEANVVLSRYESYETTDDDASKANDDSSVRSDYETASYVDTGRSVASAARSFVREKAKDAIRGRQKDFFTGQNQNSNTLLAVAQSKWVDDDPIPSILVPVADFSDISNTILAMRAVWSAIKYDSCATAQQKLTRQISDLRKSNPISSLLTNTPSDMVLHLPIQITGVEIGGSESSASLERVKIKVEKKTEEGGAMATFFNPYANKDKEEEATLIPEGEERYILVKFANKLSIPMEIPRCQLEFEVPTAVKIKAPAISFMIPGQTSDFAVQFPFIFLNEGGESVTEQESQVFTVKGLHVTCLTRSFFLHIDGSNSDDDAAAKQQQEQLNIPRTTSLYPRRDYEEASLEIKSPRLEVVSAQPNLLISFAAATKSPLIEDAVIPAPIADGETFTIPKLLLRNNPGLGNNGQIEELCISAIGLPGLSEVVLFDLNKPVENDTSEKQVPLLLKALCTGIDAENLNNPGKAAKECSISLQLIAATDMGAHNKGAEVKLRFRYRGKPASSALEVWRTMELTLHVLRIKGPRVSSITFRPDLAWGSGYTQLCTALAEQDKHARYRFARQDSTDLPKAGSSDDTDFVLNRLGKDPGVHVCDDKVVIILSVANETAASIRLSSPDGAIGGFDGSPIDTMKVTSGISAKIPMIIPRVDRSSEMCDRLHELTTLHWESEEVEGDATAEIETSGSMVPVNKRVRSGTLKIPMHCLKTIVDENPSFLSRICKSPCAISIAATDGGGTAEGKSMVKKGDSVDLSAQVDLADWIPADLLEKNNLNLEFCCAPAEGTKKGKKPFIWCGQVKKSLSRDSKSAHRARVIFLSEGEYFVSACVTFKRNDVDDDVKELWWPPKAHLVKVGGDSVLKQ